MLLFTVLFTSCFWLLFSSVAMHLVATGTTFAFPLLLQHITAYLTTCDVRPQACRVCAWLVYLFCSMTFFCTLAAVMLLRHCC